MISGVGVDLVKINRFSIGEKSFINKILSSNEIILLADRKSERRKLEFIAGRFAAKEAYLKALGVGIGPIPFRTIEVLADENGKPYIKDDDYNVNLSITHTETDACAFVVLEKK